MYDFFQHFVHEPQAIFRPSSERILPEKDDRKLTADNDRLKLVGR